MKEKIAIISIFCFLIMHSCSKEQAKTAVDPKPFQAILDETIKPYLAATKGRGIGMGLYIKGDDLNVYVSSGLPEDYKNNIRFSSESLAITFIGAAILKLQEQGKLNIDDYILAMIPGRKETYFPNTDDYAIPFKEDITIRQLINHRAGVFDVTSTPVLSNVDAPYAGQNYLTYHKELDGPSRTFSFEEMIGVVVKHKLSYFKPNAGYHYSITGYHILAVIIERITAKPLFHYLKDEFLIPLGMKNTTVAKTGGGIVTTPEDLSVWTSYLYDAKNVHNDYNSKEVEILYSPGEDAVPGYIITMSYHPATRNSYVVFSTLINVNDAPHQAKDMDAVINRTIRHVEMNDL